MPRTTIAGLHGGVKSPDERWDVSLWVRNLLNENYYNTKSVTSGDSGAAGNFGPDEHYDYETRYGRAHEYLDVVHGLWRSYEDDALVRDRETGVFLDPEKLHALGHKGQYFSVAGPLNIPRSPQGDPVVFQARYCPRWRSPSPRRLAPACRSSPR